MNNAKGDTYTINGEEFLTTTGIAKKLGCSPMTIQRKVAQKKIRYIRILNRLLFRPSFAEEFINNQIVAPR